MPKERHTRSRLRNVSLRDGRSRSMSTIDGGCNYHVDLSDFYAPSRVHVLYIDYWPLYKSCNATPGTPIKWAISFGRLDADLRRTRPIIDDGWLQGPKWSEWCERALLNDASVPTGKRLFRNDLLATGHPLTRIRVFNSASEGNEEGTDRARRRHIGMRMEAIGRHRIFTIAMILSRIKIIFNDRKFFFSLTTA